MAAKAGETALAAFYDRYRHDPLVMDKWFAVQSGLDAPGRLAVVRRLLDHPDFTPHRSQPRFCRAAPVRRRGFPPISTIVRGKAIVSMAR